MSLYSAGNLTTLRSYHKVFFFNFLSLIVSSRVLRYVAKISMHTFLRDDWDLGIL